MRLDGCLSVYGTVMDEQNRRMMDDGRMDVATAGATCVRASRPLEFLVHPLELHFEFTAGEVLSAAPSFETRLSSCLHALLFLHPNSATCLCSCLWLSGSHTYTHTQS